MPKFAIETEPFTETAPIEAAYYIVEDGFVTLKDDQHKQVASFSAHHVIAIVRVDPSEWLESTHQPECNDRCNPATGEHYLA